MGRRRKSNLLPDGTFELHITYPHIYLVADGGEKGASIRITKRDEHGRPGEVHFAGRRPDQFGQPMGTLVIDDELWEKWFGHRERLPHMDTALKAAQWIVANCTNIYFGCPLCLFRTKSYDEYLEHIRGIGKWVMEQFKVQVEMNPTATVQEEIEDGE